MKIIRITIILILACKLYAAGVIGGIGYSKDLNADTRKFNTSNQFTILSEISFEKISIGSTVRYYNMFEADDSRLIYIQMLFTPGLIYRIDELRTSIHGEFGFWERDKALNVYDKDKISDDLLHESTPMNASANKGNAYYVYGVKFQALYQISISDKIKIDPVIFIELLKSKQFLNHNPIIGQYEKSILMYTGLAICIEF